ncbi:DUF1127 domain-containing protein (plasmid) [Rhizobium sp. T1470]|uniref:DUF1127 domain-containing protein n=1 Tax=unclassified Rhizobium TaxID=2613769 RepID=UPI001AAF3BDD|nr:DUF1127 domain-containing protein [Rhizobium sp. T1473]MCA0804865.1 DUF1127 domain-containing protein [Rhizobium sp. T1473]
MKKQRAAVDNLAASIEELCARFGVGATVFALLVAAWRYRRAPNTVATLSDWMRRDLALGED